MGSDPLPFPKHTAKQERCMGEGQDGKERKKDQTRGTANGQNNPVTQEQPQRENAEKEIHEGTPIYLSTDYHIIDVPHSGANS